MKRERNGWKKFMVRDGKTVINEGFTNEKSNFPDMSAVI